MAKPNYPLLWLLLAALVAGCAQGSGTSANPSSAGAAPAMRPADFFPYRFTGGSGSAHFSATGPFGSCDGRAVFDDVSVYVKVDSDGKVEPGLLSTALITGSAPCQAKPIPLPLSFALTTGKIVPPNIATDIVGDPKEPDVIGKLVMSGSLCDATVHLNRWVGTLGKAHLNIDPVNITKVEKSTGC